MATLDQPYWAAIPPLLQDVFQELGRQSFISRFYLAGGTALALQLGHRLSVDLDFFSDTDELGPESQQEIIRALQKRFPVEVDAGGLSSLLIGIEGSYVGFFSYSYPLLSPTVSVAGVRLAGLLDIGLMKLDAVAGRGSRKDFYDLYFLVQEIPLEELLEQGQNKYPQVRDFSMMVLTALADFSIADQQADIETRPAVSWDAVKQFFTEEIRHAGRDWFEG
jgi:predicted nucleotidyltransferase component of viral defense system